MAVDSSIHNINSWNKVIVMDPPTLAMVEVPLVPTEDAPAVDTGAYDVLVPEE